MNRLSFGANDTARANLAALGAQGWLEAQLAMPVSDADLDERLAGARLRLKYQAGDDGKAGNWAAMDELRPLAALTADPADYVGLLDFTKAVDYSERTHPGTAQYVCRKLFRRLLVDDPDQGMINRLAGVFLMASDAPDQIAQVLRAIVADPLLAGTKSGKLRRPFEFLSGLYRAIGAEVKSPDLAFDWQLARAGWHQHSYGPPTGHPDRASRCRSASTMNRYVDIAFFAHDDWFGCTDTRLGAATPESAKSFAKIARYWVARLRGTGAPDVLAILAEGYGVTDADAPMNLSAEDLRGGAAMAVTFAALNRQFMLR